MMDNPISLAVLGAVITIVPYLIHRIDVWNKRTGWSQDGK